MENIFKKVEKARLRMQSHNPFADACNKVINGTNTVRDATRRAQYQEKLHETNETLEARVSERTAELEKVNRQLRREIEERIYTEKLLRESEEKFRVIAETASDAIVSVNQNSQITFVNTAAETIFGYEISEMIGRDLTLLMPEYLKEVHTNDLTDLWVSENRQNSEWSGMELTGRHKNNYDIPLEVSFGKSFVNGKHSFHGIIRDISSRKKVRQYLIESEQKFRAVFEHSSAGMCLADLDGNSLLVNPSLCHMLGLSMSDCMDRKLRDLIHTDYRHINLDLQEQLLNGQKNTVQCSLRFVHEGGHGVWVEATTTLLRSEAGSPKYFVTHLRDMTEQVKINQRLTREKDLAEGIVDSLPGIFYILDEQGTLLKCNTNFERITGYKAEEISSDSLSQLFNTIDQTNIQNDILEAFKGNHSELEATLITKSGREIPYYFTGEAVFYDGKRCIMGMGLDITERKLAEEAINLYAQKLKKLNMSKDKFFSIIAHDLRSPFTGLIGLSDILSTDFISLSPDEASFFAGKINTSAKKVFQLLNNLLEWSRVQLNGTELNPEVINLNQLAQKSCETLHFNLKAKNITVLNDIDPDIRILADSTMISSVFQNLISNSLKFTERNGEIKLHVKEAEDKITASITDTGIGMSQKVIDRLFQLDKTISREGTETEPGSGLGLILCKEFIEKHNGEIWAESTEGKGSTFNFSIPKQPVLI